MPRRLRSFLAMALVVLAAWAVLSFAHESYRRTTRGLHPKRGIAPILWRFGEPQPKRLEHFLRRMTHAIPAGSQIAFESEPGANSAFYRAAWAAYFLPHLDVVPFFRREAIESDYWLAYGPPRRPGFELVREDRRGRLYRPGVESD